MQAVAERLLHALLWLAAPPECVACEARSKAPLCEPCGGLLVPPAPRTLEGVPVLAALAYRPPFDGVIQRFKYHARPDLARGLAALTPPGSISAADLLVPVPLHPRRLAERGYNQAALLARALASSHGARVRARALARVHDTPRQARLPRAERAQNVSSAFQALSAGDLAGRRIALVDDVVTTGATAAACIRALRGVGVSVRAVLAVASAEA
jgi:ComF family protein